MTFDDLVAEEVPELPVEERSRVLWNYTSFPCFWNISEDGATPEACCRKQLRTFRERWLREGAFWDPIAEALANVREEP